MTDIEQYRPGFEAWARRQGLHHDKYEWGEYRDGKAQLAWGIWAAAKSEASDAQDAARYRYIEENATTHGGGNGFTLACFVPVDEEDIGCAIDAAIAAQVKE